MLSPPGAGSERCWGEANLGVMLSPPGARLGTLLG